MKKVTMKPLVHREQVCIGIYFEYEKELSDLIKQTKEFTFTQTHKCWYAIDTGRHSRLKVYQTMRKMGIQVDYSAYQDLLDEKKSLARERAANLRVSAVDAVAKQMKLKGYSNQSIRTYVNQFDQFLRFYPTSLPTEIGEDEIREYLLYLIDKRKLSRSTQNQAINAIKFFYEHVNGEPRKVYYLERPFKEKRLPTVLSQEDVLKLFEATDNMKHRLMLMLIYSAGLRRGELLNLKTADLDFARMTVFVRGGKGRKDRQTVLAQTLKPLFDEYHAIFRPTWWLFEGTNGSKYSARSLQQVLKKSLDKAGLNKEVTLHTLRHSFATHLLESGTSTRYIQTLLGHESPKTTEIYAHVTRFGMDKLRSPLDQLRADKMLGSGAEKEE